MAHIIADRVQETSATVGTGTLTLAGAVTGFRTFGSVMANGDTIYYTITDQLSSANWEVGVGTWSTGGTLDRTTILESSNANAAVNFTSGALYVFGTYAADKAVYKDLNDGVGLGVTTPSATLHIKPGTAAAGTAPIKINSGTLMTAAEAGAVEYDGRLNYFTPAGTSRALTPSSYFYRKNSDTVLTSNNTAQSWLGLTSGVTLQASTIYYVDGEFRLTTTGTTSHTEAIGFTLTTATLSAVTGISVVRRAVQTAAVTGITGYITSTASGTTVITGAITTAQTMLYTIKGVLCVNAAGQVNPVIQFSAGPGGTSTVTGAWISFTPIGTTGSNVSIGTWA